MASQPGSADAAERAEKFRRKYWDKLQTLRHQPLCVWTVGSWVSPRLPAPYCSPLWDLVPGRQRSHQHHPTLSPVPMGP